MTPALPEPGLPVPVLPVALLAGTIQALAGFGAVLLALPLLAFALSVETLVPLMALPLMTVSGLNMLRRRHAVRATPVPRLLAGYLNQHAARPLRPHSGSELGLIGCHSFHFAHIPMPKQVSTQI